MPTEEPTMPDRPRIAIVCESLPPYRVRLHSRIRAELPEVELLTAVTHQPEDEGRWPTVSQERLPHVVFGPGETIRNMRNRRYLAHEWRKGGRIIRWLKSERVRAVIIHGYNDLARLRILFWCHRNKIPAFISGDSNIRIDRAASWRGRLLKRPILQFILRHARACLPFGSLGAKYFASYGVKRTFYFSLEPDYDLLTSLPPELIQQARERYSFDPSRRRLIYSGRLAPEKRVDLLVNAFAALAPRRRDWDLVILGSGSSKPELLRQGKPLGNRIIWIDALIDPAEVFAVYRCCDVLVLPSDYEPWGLVVNEADASGLAVVSSSTVGAAAELVHPENGATFTPGDLQSLVQALENVTDAETLPARKAASVAVINAWRKDGDPVQGLRSALVMVGVIADSPPSTSPAR